MPIDYVIKTGPIFDGRAEFYAREATRAISQKVAETGKAMVKSELDRVLKHPTGYYRSKIQSSRHGNDWTIDDSGVIYGPWLEGVGSRNFPVTRFKGYSTFRRVRQELEKRFPLIAREVLNRYVRRMG